MRPTLLLALISLFSAACDTPATTDSASRRVSAAVSPVAPAVSSAGETSTTVVEARPNWAFDLSALPDDETSRAIRRGKAIADATAQLLPDHVGNGLRCTNCHLAAGTTPHAAAWVGVTDRYPQYRARTGKDDTIEERINDCFERSMNGTALAVGSDDMKALVAWMTWLSATVDGKAIAEQAKIPLSKLQRAPNLDHGKAVYDTRCIACHAADGAGVVAPDGTVAFPALAGPRSFNIGAGMARLRTAAGFIQHNMPLGQGNTLNDDEAFDVAAYVTRLPRPDFAAKAKDWPTGGKPDDARY